MFVMIIVSGVPGEMQPRSRLGSVLASLNASAPMPPFALGMMVSQSPTFTEETVKDPRLLAVFSEAAGGWRIAPGAYKVLLGSSASKIDLETMIRLGARRLPATYRP